MRYNFTEIDIKNITKAFGEEFYAGLADALEKYCGIWNLKILSLVDYFSVNCIFICESRKFGDCVLKVSSNSTEELTAEYNTLIEYQGRHHCEVYAADLANGVILLEKITPGTRLKDEPSLNKRLCVFASLYNGLHIAPADAEKYVGYTKKVSDRLEAMRNYAGRDKDKVMNFAKLYAQMEKANKICVDLCGEYDKQMLLHGDMHYDNIILGSGGYVLIDPQGFVGDPVFDIARYLLNEMGNMDESLQFVEKFTAMRAITVQLQSLTGVPYAAMEKCLFVDIVLLSCWEVTACMEAEVDFESIALAEYLLEH